MEDNYYDPDFIYYEDDYYDEDYFPCSLCNCLIGDEVRYGYEMAPGKHVCIICAGDYDEDE